MKQNILLGLVLFSLTTSSSTASAPQPVSEEDTSSSLVEKSEKISPKKRPARLIFPQDFGSVCASQTATLDNTVAEASDEEVEKVLASLNLSKRDPLSTIKHTAAQLAIHGKQLTLQVFTKENAHRVQFYLNIVVDRVTTIVAMIAVLSYESMKWMFDVLSSLRDSHPIPKPIEKAN